MEMDDFFGELIKLGELINNGATVEETLELVFDSCKTYVPYNRIGIALLDNNGHIYAHVAKSDYEAMLNGGYSTNLVDTSLGEVISSRNPRIIRDYIEHYKNNPYSEATKLIIEEGIRSSATLPLVSNNECIGVIFFSSTKFNEYNESHFKFLKLISYHMGIAIEKNLIVEDLIVASVTGFAKLVEAKDMDTGKHVERIQNYSRILAKVLSKTEKYKYVIGHRFIKDIYNFSSLHDIGKVGIPDKILLKPGKLTPEEFEIMKTHSTIGANVLREACSNVLNDKGRHVFDMGIEIAEGHHEKYNGKGYPKGLSGDDIPISARIVAVADVFDALTSKRVYKDAFDMDSSLKMIVDESGKSFDPDVVDALLKSLPDVMEIYKKLKENVEECA